MKIISNHPSISYVTVIITVLMMMFVTMLVIIPHLGALFFCLFLTACLMTHYILSYVLIYRPIVDIFGTETSYGHMV